MKEILYCSCPFLWHSTHVHAKDEWFTSCVCEAGVPKWHLSKTPPPELHIQWNFDIMRISEIQKNVCSTG
jgi:hypothetical protein